MISKSYPRTMRQNHLHRIFWITLVFILLAMANGGVASAQSNSSNITITSPAQGTSFMGWSMVSIRAAVTNNVAKISKVEFFVNSVKIGEDASAPFIYNWVNPPKNIYKITARATMGAGLFIDSQPVTINVNRMVIKNVSWTDVKNATPFGILLNGIKKINGCDGCDDASGSSNQQIVSGDGYTEFIAYDTNSNRWIGLDKFVFKLWDQGSIDILEENKFIKRFNYVWGDRFRIAYSGGKVKYFKNGSLIYTSELTPAYPAKVSTSLWSFRPASGVTASLAYVKIAGTMLSDSLNSIAVPVINNPAITDRKIYTVPSAPILPAAGDTFVDPTFKTTLMRLTDSSSGSGCRIAYSYWPTFNANSTRLHVYCDNLGPLLYDFDPIQFKIIGSKPLFGSKAPSGKNLNWEDSIWSDSNPDILYAHDGTSLYAYNVATNTYALIKKISDLLPEGNKIWQMSKSKDDNRFAWTELDSNNKRIGYAVFEKSSGKLIYKQNILHLPIDEVQLDKSGKYLVVKFVGASPSIASQIIVKIVNIDTASVTDLNSSAPGFAPGHSDNGIATVIGADPWSNSIRLRDITVQDKSFDLINFGKDWSQAQSVSAMSNDEKWALVSTYVSNSDGLFHNEIFQVATDGSTNVRRLAHHRSVFGGDYFNQPNANISRDGNFVTFTSNWDNVNNRRDVFIIKVPN